MGSCISNCRPKRKSQGEFNRVQDKLEIIQAPISPIPLSTTKPLSPLSTSTSPSPSSTSSFSCTSSYTSSSCSLTSSCSSSISASKDRSFSNEFLLSCLKQNPQILRLDRINASPAKSVATKVNARKKDSSTKPIVVAPVKQSIPQKRPRVSSPTLSRQKSFREEAEKPKTLRSPSPSRRFIGGDNYRGVSTNAIKENCCSKCSVLDSGSSCVRKENLRPASPNNNSSRYISACLRNRERCIYQIGSKIDEVAVGEVMSKSNKDMDSVPMEDIDNPLIALDCFIFL